MKRPQSLIDYIKLAVPGDRALYVRPNNTGHAWVEDGGSWKQVALTEQDLATADIVRNTTTYEQAQASRAQIAALCDWKTRNAQLLEEHPELAAEFVDHVHPLRTFQDMDKPALAVAYLTKHREEIAAQNAAAGELVDELIFAAQEAG